MVKEKEEVKVDEKAGGIESEKVGNEKEGIGEREKSLMVKPEKTKEMSLQETVQLGDIIAKSRRFSEIQSAQQAVIQILAGRELGVGPITAMTKIFIVRGKVCISAEIMAGQIKKSRDYDYKIKKLTNEECSISFIERGKEVGVSIFTIDDAKKAGVYKVDSGWSKFPRNMLFARALSNGARWYCPDAIQGAYTPEEMGTTIDQSGEVINGEIIETAPVEVMGDSKPEIVETPKAERNKQIKETAITIGGKIYEDMKENDGKKKIDEMKKKFGTKDKEELVKKLGLEFMKSTKKELGIKDKIDELPEMDYQDYLKKVLSCMESGEK